MKLNQYKIPENTSAPPAPTTPATTDSYREGSNQNTRNNIRNYQYNRNNCGYTKKSLAKNFEGRSD